MRLSPKHVFFLVVFSGLVPAVLTGHYFATPSEAPVAPSVFTPTVRLGSPPKTASVARTEPSKSVPRATRKHKRVPSSRPVPVTSATPTPKASVSKSSEPIVTPSDQPTNTVEPTTTETTPVPVEGKDGGNSKTD